MAANTDKLSSYTNDNASQKRSGEVNYDVETLEDVVKRDLSGITLKSDDVAAVPETFRNPSGSELTSVVSKATGKRVVPDNAHGELYTSHRRGDWETLKSLAPYVFKYKWRVVFAMAFLIMAKVANVLVPIMLKMIIDDVSVTDSPLETPIKVILGYGVLRVVSSSFGELRDAIFARATQGAIRSVALEVFQHLNLLSLRFHLARQTGGVNRDIDRGAKGIQFLLMFTLFNILPTLVEILMTSIILFSRYIYYYAVITLGTVAIYIGFTLGITEWRMKFRRQMNDLDAKASSRAVDALLNFETVKYFNNEHYEARQYDAALAKWEKAATYNQVSLSLLNAGQAFVIAIGITALVWLAAWDVVRDHISIGDLVLINSYLLQLYTPLNYLGTVYREIKNSMADMERMFGLFKVNVEVRDAADAISTTITHAHISFKDVEFGYDPDRQILKGVSFEIPAGKTVAVVGHSGAGKSTLSRLLYRFYDVWGGSVEINGVDIRRITQDSLRTHVGIVPQDTVLFNDSIYYNIAYGNPEATRDEVIAAAKAASIYDFIEGLPSGFDTPVGERGLKLSGGEKQRVAIARCILKNPPILIFDEATSALDSKTEKIIQNELKAAAQNRTALVIAHRLSTIADADEILVMDDGQIIERGTHKQLLMLDGHYSRLWKMQQAESKRKASSNAGL